MIFLSFSLVLLHTAVILNFPAGLIAESVAVYGISFCNACSIGTDFFPCMTERKIEPVSLLITGGGGGSPVFFPASQQNSLP